MIRNGQYMVIDLLIHNSMGRLLVNCSFYIEPHHSASMNFPLYFEISTSEELLHVSLLPRYNSSLIRCSLVTL